MNYIVFDLEATCWKNKKLNRRQEIIEIGAIKSNLYGEQKSVFESIIRPVEHPVLSWYCKELTGISQQEVHRADTVEKVLDEFLYWSGWEDGVDTIFCSWGSKDRDLLKVACENAGLPDEWLAEYIDLKAQFAEVRGLDRTVGLKKALKMLDEDFEGSHHRALDDAKNLFTIFIRHLDAWIY